MELDFKYSRCQEVLGASPVDPEKLFECGKPATMVVFHSHDGRNVYTMCEMCGYHNVKNRGGIELVPKEE